MNHMRFPDLKLEGWRESRDALHGYVKVLGKARQALSPPQKHWWHITLHVSASGLTTTAMPAGARLVELILDPVTAQLQIHISDGEKKEISLSGFSQAQTADALCAALNESEIDLPLASHDFDTTSPSRLDRAALGRYWRALGQIDSIFKRFKGSLQEETSPVQLFPHHFDLTMNWFSGRLIPGQDPDDAENAAEQMTFGFVTGDLGLKEPYFYATAYPEPTGFTDQPLPGPANWHSAGFSGAVLKYRWLVGSERPAELLLDFLNATRDIGRKLMC